MGPLGNENPFYENSANGMFNDKTCGSVIGPT